MNVLGFIPARAGSERVKNKNIRELKGKPLIAYTIEAALNAASINRVVVSTDSQEIASTARQWGAEVPFMRPAEIAGRNSTEMEFFLHALDWFSAHEQYEPDLIVLLYPTSPFRRTKTIDRAVETMMKHQEADSLRSITACTEHPYKMWRIDGDYLKPFVRGEEPNMHTWSYCRLPQVYIQNASIYITKPATLYNKKSPTGDLIVPFVMDAQESIDINTPLDFAFAEMIMEKDLLNEEIAGKSS
ncbi:MAG: acylneuraminate cytidylyltransferase family protein [Candidatus Auribacter fodinae]|jgi:N-acylneuraminate cytidylyltransferase|uniref:Acylneuraminate cytidylyltransferase family protein n=1 Tax=Candidatus Auribacter fodinae TaxID=2093366 RepID=A0A3A4R5A8_9BACT|nr:MAG: acylneuraminate cytidylyltransferase family protein [Candidatus Auribacter fodinae]